MALCHCATVGRTNRLRHSAKCQSLQLDLLNKYGRFHVNSYAEHSIVIKLLSGKTDRLQSKFFSITSSSSSQHVYITDGLFHSIAFTIFYILLTVHLDIPSGRWQTWRTVLLYTIIRLFQSSTCFEQTRAHHQEVNCTNTASGIVTLCKWPSGLQVEQELFDLHTGQRVTIPDAVLTFRHRVSCILGQAFRYSPEKAFYIFNRQIYFIIWYLLDRASLK